MSVFDKYNTPSPSVRTQNELDNPLIPHSGVPTDSDGFPDSTDQIVSPTNQSDNYFNNSSKAFDVDPGQFYGSAGLSGIDMAPNSKKQFDLGKFNNVFDREKQLIIQSNRLKDLDKLNALSQTENRTKLYDLALFQIIINSKNAWFDLLDDLLDQRFELQTFTKHNRLFYIGLTIMVFAIIMYLYTMIVSDIEDNTKQPEQIKKIYHIYQTVPPSSQTSSSISTQASSPSQTD